MDTLIGRTCVLACHHNKFLIQPSVKFMRKRDACATIWQFPFSQPSLVVIYAEQFYYYFAFFLFVNRDG